LTPNAQGEPSTGRSPPLSGDRPWWLRYGAALLGVGLALALRWGLLLPVLGPELPFTIFWGAVLFAAWFGGPRPGLLATTLSSAAVIYFLVEPQYELAIGDARGVIELGIFITTSLAIVFCVKWLRQ
jgi:K+-sensing histidine kinase KdpD